MKKTAVFTIASKNYLSYARVFTKSFQKFHPNVPVFVLLVDKIDGYFNPTQEPFQIIESDTLAIPHIKDFFFKYNILELNTAVKPYFIEKLMLEGKFENVFYFDPDILITGSINKLIAMLEKTSITLTPHIRSFIDDEKKPSELDILRAGTYNLGFIGVRNTKQGTAFLQWWQKRVYNHCLYKIEEGMFVDQKWIDLVPSFFPEHIIIREPIYNVAYWNLHERLLQFNSKDKTKAYIEGQQMVFFHFSGFEVENINIVSRHQTRFSLQKNLRPLTPFFTHYHDLQIKHGYKTTKNWPYAYGQFDNNVPISNNLRKIFFSLDKKIRNRFANPFSTKDNKSFFNWLTTPIKNEQDKDLPITNFLYQLYMLHKPIQENFSDILNDDRKEFLNWILTQGKYEHQIHDVFLQHLYYSVKNQKNDTKKSVLRKIFYHPILQRNKFLIRRIVGDKLFYQARNFLVVQLIHKKKHKKNSINIKKQRLKIKNPGINVVGHFTAESGTGEAARSCAKAIEAAIIPFVLQNFTDNIYRKNDISFETFSKLSPYSINLVCINADQVDVFFKTKNGEKDNNKYTIGYWLWEQSIFPNQWYDRFQFFDEIWTSSTFSQQAIAKSSPLPVIRVPLTIDIPKKLTYSRSDFSIHSDLFVFLFVFDFLSVFERKNPTGVIDAFLLAFGDKKDVLLVIKTVNSQYNPKAFEIIQSKIRNKKNIRLIDGYFHRQDINKLMQISDSYISLHRSEGYGYTIFEAMYYGKPVIATAYSGNMDIMNINNSFPVKYTLQELKNDFGPYKKTTIWAEPNIEDASLKMKYVYENISVARQIGKVGMIDVIGQLHPKSIGKIIKQRLQIINNF